MTMLQMGVNLFSGAGYTLYVNLTKPNFHIGQVSYIKHCLNKYLQANTITLVN